MMIFFFKTLNLNYVVHYITDSRVTDAISNKFQAVRADGNSDLSNEIGIELSKKSAAAGMRYTTLSILRLDILRSVYCRKKVSS